MKRITSTIIVCALAALLITAGAQAATYNWTGAISTDWATSGNWNIAGYPGSDGASTTDAANIYDNTSATAVTMSGAQYAGQVCVGGKGGSSSAISYGYLNVSQNLTITGSNGFRIGGTTGDYNYGKVVQTAGDVSVTGTFAMGWNTNDEGVYVMQGGTLTQNKSNTGLTIGRYGTAIFTQSGGNVYANLGSTVFANAGGTGEVHPNVLYDISGGSVEFKQLTLASNGSSHASSTAVAELKISGTGSVTLTSNTTLRVGQKAGATGTITMTGGTLNIYGGGASPSHSIALGDEGATGYFTQSGGTCSVTGSILVGSKAGGVGTMTLSGAAQTSATKLEVGYSNADTGTLGTLILKGSRTGSGTDMSVSEVFRLGSDTSPNASTLKAVIDATAVSTPSAMRKIVVTTNAYFYAGSLLDVGFDSGVTPTAGTWTLLTCGTLTDNGLAFAPGVDTSKWSFSADTVAKTLTVTYVPEPATMSLLALGGLGLLLKRKRT